MRVDERVVVPARRRPRVGRVQLAYRNHRVLGLAVDPVAVNVEVLVELVVLLDPLELGEGIRHQRRVDDADVGRRLGVVSQCARLGVRRRGVWLFLDAGDSVGVPRCRDIAIDVLRLERARIGLDLELLHDPRVDGSDEEAAHQEQRGADEREAPAADDRGDDEEQRHDGGRAGENLTPGDDGVDIGVGGADEEVAAGRRTQGRILVEPDAHSLESEIDRTGDRELDAGCAGDAHLTAVETQGTVEIAGRERGDDRDEDHRGGEGGGSLIERQREEIEGDVEMELGVGFAGGRAVDPLEGELPARRCGDAREDSEHRGDAVHGEAAQRLDDLLVAVELGVELRIDRTPSEGHVDAHEDRNGHTEEADEEHHRAGDPLCREHIEVAELVEPQPVSVEAREDEEDDDKNRDDGDRDENGGSRSRRWPSLFG